MTLPCLSVQEGLGARNVWRWRGQFVSSGWLREWPECAVMDALKVRDPDLSAVFVPFRLEREGLPA